MRINNPLQMNDWEIKKLLKVVLALQLALWGAIGLDATGLQIPIIRQFIGFVYLTFIPGIIILRILKLHKLGNIETLLYTIGLSIATLMFTGLFMNTIYPLFGVSGPISLVPLIITISVVVLVLCVLSYLRDKDFSDPSFIDVGDILSPPALFLCLLPFLAIFGTYLVNYYKNNIFLMLLIIIIVLTVILVAFDKFIPKKLYPLAVFVIAISLLFHISLISSYLYGGYDVHAEYHVFKLVKIDSHWDSTIPRTSNAMLSITILPAIYSYLLNMDGIWVFKIIYHIIYSFMPLGLYQVYQKQTEEKTAFLSTFFFMSIMNFWGMVGLTRQEIAELFYILLMILMLNRGVLLLKCRILFIIFSACMIVSHYGLSYVYMFFSLPAFAILVYVMKNKSRIFTAGSIAIFLTMILSWYMYIGSSAPFDAIVHIGDHIYGSIFTDLFNPEARGGVQILLAETMAPLHEVCKILHYTTQFFIIVGISKLLLQYKKMKFSAEYVSFSIINFGILILCVVVPYFEKMNFMRTYHITLIFLAPFCILGGKIVLEFMSKILSFVLHHYINLMNIEAVQQIKIGRKRKVDRALNPKRRKIFDAESNCETASITLKIISFILIVFFLFNIGFVYEIAGDPYPTSLPLSGISYVHSVYTEGEVIGITWLSNTMDKHAQVYVEHGVGNALSEGIFGSSSYSFYDDTGRVQSNAYVYLGYRNIKFNKIRIKQRSMKYFENLIDFHNSTFYNNVLLYKNKIYDNGNSQIYH